MSSRNTITFQQHPPLPRLLISYSGSIPEVGVQVLDLAEDLRIAGVEVLLDQREPGKGDNPEWVMQQLHGDPSMGKALMIASGDESGQAWGCLPYGLIKFLKLIDLSQIQAKTEAFGRLLRWIYDQPLQVAPILDRSPTFLEAAGSDMVWTATSYRQAMKAITRSLGMSSSNLAND
jgi:hypothetical protein